MLKLVMECVKCSSGKSRVSDFMTMPVSLEVSFVFAISELNASIIAGTMSVAMTVG